MIPEEILLKLKEQVHNKKHIQINENYVINGEAACKETYLRRKIDKTGYIVGHDDFLEKFEDIPDLHFKYERKEFENFNDAVYFLIENYGINF